MAQRYNFFYFEAGFKKYLIAGNAESSTVKNYLSDLHYFFSWVQGTLHVKELEHIELPDFFTHSLIRSYHGYLISSTNADKTIIRRLATLRKFFQFCIEQRWLTSNPANDFANRNKQDEREELVIEYAKTLKARGKSDIDLARHINVVRDFITSS